MNVVDLHNKILADYESFIRSFINIRNPRIKDVVETELASNKLWPDPLIQFSPSYETSESIDDLFKEHLVHSHLKYIVGSYKLYKHQTEAIKLGVQGKDFVVTSGTGSGKSLTYLATIFDHILRNNVGQKGIKAIIVYPMNALINSQSEEINKYRENFERELNLEFPIKFGQYTGQENEEERARIKEDLPHIILTNYMMLELIMTRPGERELRKSIFEDLKFLVFDELHTYRGRQGSDISMLIRRIKSNASNKLVCIGTSATMVSDDNSSPDEKKRAVAGVASKIFGTEFSADQVINEYLVSSLGTTDEEVTPEELASCLNETIPEVPDEKIFRKNKLAVWIERNVALEYKDGMFVRRKPKTLDDIASELREITHSDLELCKSGLLNTLECAAKLNSDEKKSGNILPFKLHQFISQTGTVYVTLDMSDNQFVTLDPGAFKNVDDVNLPLYPVVFSRLSGCEFICVYKNTSKGTLLPREFKQVYDEDEEAQGGYLIPDSNIWNPDEDMDSLPDTYFNVNVAGERRLKNEYKHRIPTKIYFDKEGNFSETEQLEFEGWYMPAKLLFDPSSGTFFDTKTSEGTKLTKLGTEGRSTSTTVLSLNILKQLHHAKYSFADQKLLSFTDNRQDAALQSGHFNDFVEVVMLRSAIYNALKHSKNNQLDFSTLPDAIFKSLNLKQEEYAANPSANFPSKIRDNEEALKLYIMYRALYDLRRGWRVILPNLEQCALLEIDYANLKENCEHEAAWENILLLKDFSVRERIDFVYQILDYFRKEYAIHSENYLATDVINNNRKKINELLREPWKFEKNEDINEPCYMRIDKLLERVRFFHKSIGPRSSLGKYIRLKAKEKGLQLNENEYRDFMTKLLSLLKEGGWIHEKNVRNGNSTIKTYRLNISEIIWKAGNEESVKQDPVKLRSYMNNELKPNLFFQNLYKTEFGKYKRFIGDVHTGQNSYEEKKESEVKFRKGDISALYCSPTMELGIDISTLNVVHMRNAPPNPANYAQRSGRAGRSGKAALVFTYCSAFAPHDVHYFKNSVKMVAGNVIPPRLEFSNEELLLSHLNAVCFAELNLGGGQSILDFIDISDRSALPLKSDVSSNIILSDSQKRSLTDLFKRIICDFEPELAGSRWFNDTWIRNNIERFPFNFDKAFDRWRTLYRSAMNQLEEAQRVIRDGVLGTAGETYRTADRKQHQAQKQLKLLANNSNSNSLSEFYPYRYLASEGFLPGYNFTRLPLRTFIPSGDSGAYISRPRFLAIREFGPGNLIYHKGAKYKIEELICQDLESSLKEAKVVTSSGYYLEGDQLNSELCPFTDVNLTTENSAVIKDLVEMSDTRTELQKRISCEEEERLTHGYLMNTYFSVPAGMESVVTAKVKNDGQDFLNVRFIPTARLVKVNRKWKINNNEGFLIGMTSGLFKKKSQLENANENIKCIKLYTTDTADSLYIEPVTALGLEYEGVLTLQYALKRAIENMFQVESNEIGVELMGNPSHPNIFIYESSEGSLGVLSQFVEDVTKYKELIEEAIRVCRYEEEEYKEPASYDDLLSYYNQPFHDKIDRFLIKDALEKLRVCSLEIITSDTMGDYDEHYQRLLRMFDPNSSTELRFLKYLYDNNLRLPDDAQKRVDGIYAQPDFFYKPDIHIFCDGTPHDDPATNDKDRIIRDAIRDSGQQVIVYHYKDDLDELVERRPDVFRKVR